MIRCPHCDPTWMFAELVFSAVVIVLCMLIFFRTKEMYGLTRHKGINYFRTTFLFFALAFFFRFAFHLFSISGIVFDFSFPRQIIGPLPLLVTGYFSTIAIFYLLLSLVWKRVNSEQFLAVAHVAAFLLASVVFVFRSAHFLALIQVLLIIFVLILAYLRSRHSRSFSGLFVIYVLLFVGWLANIMILSPRFRIPFEVMAVSYAVSVAVLGVIFYKVYRWTG
ncbi:hypothetical protein HQ545_03295 [Candidatus Woesearchaeota archaeon]|nr:hypothetical protein [Candidatus Woesearchaeota archaeon]